VLRLLGIKQRQAGNVQNAKVLDSSALIDGRMHQMGW